MIYGLYLFNELNELLYFDLLARYLQFDWYYVLFCFMFGGSGVAWSVS